MIRYFGFINDLEPRNGIFAIDKYVVGNPPWFFVLRVPCPFESHRGYKVCEAAVGQDGESLATRLDVEISANNSEVTGPGDLIGQLETSKNAASWPIWVIVSVLGFA